MQCCYKRIRILGFSVSFGSPGLRSSGPLFIPTHSQVFEEGLGTLNNVMVNLAIDPSVPLKFHKARSIPFALKEKVELEIQRLEELGIISLVTHSEWAAPIVPVMKQNSDI